MVTCAVSKVDVAHMQLNTSIFEILSINENPYLQHVFGLKLGSSVSCFQNDVGEAGSKCGVRSTCIWSVLCRGGLT